jgi:hypothetical protein
MEASGLVNKLYWGRISENRGASADMMRQILGGSQIARRLMRPHRDRDQASRRINASWKPEHSHLESSCSEAPAHRIPILTCL